MRLLREQLSKDFASCESCDAAKFPVNHAQNQTHIQWCSTQNIPKTIGPNEEWQAKKQWMTNCLWLQVYHNTVTKLLKHWGVENEFLSFLATGCVHGCIDGTGPSRPWLQNHTFWICGSLVEASPKAHWSLLSGHSWILLSCDGDDDDQWWLMLII